MRLLLDHCVPKRIRRHLPSHFVATTREMGWEMLQNGLLLNQAQGQFDAMLTIDQNMRFQQNLTGLTISVVVLNAGRNTITELIAIAPAIESTLTSVQPGRFYVVSGP